MSVNQIGDGSPDGVQLPNTKAGFYGVTPVAQRASTSVQRTSNLSTISSGSLGATLQSAFNANEAALAEVMNTLAAYGLWSIS